MSCASLPMYDLPEIRWATEAWWRGLSRAFRAQGLDDVPASLSAPQALTTIWSAPDLLLSQTCGYPLVTDFSETLTPLATPVYDAEGCEGPNYRSAIVVRHDSPARNLSDLRGAKVAFNGRDSQSGYNTLRYLVAPLAQDAGYFAAAIETGSHEASVNAIAAGRADVAAIDCVTYALLQRHRPDAVAPLRVLTHSEAAPGLPYVTRATAPPDLVSRLRAGLVAAVADPDLAEARNTLLLRDFAVLPLEAYRPIHRMQVEAEALGYRALE